MRSRRFLKGLALTALTLALPVVAFAQTSRLQGMTLQSDYVKDYTNIYTFTSCVTSVGNLIYGELGTSSTLNNFTSQVGAPVTRNRAVGMVLGNLWDGRFGTWALHLREETPALGQGDDLSQPGAGFGGVDPNVNVNESFDLMWAKKFGGTSLGLRLNRSHFENIMENVFGAGVTTNLKFDPVGAALSGDENLARNIMGFGGGLGFEMNPNTSAEVGILYQSRTFENRTEPPVGSYEDDGGTTYLIAGRMMWQWQPNVVVVPVVKYYSMDLSVKTIAGATTNTWENTLSGWQAGVAGNWTLGSNDLFVLGVTFAQNKLEQQYDLTNGGLPDTAEVTETLMPQVFAALETHVNPWLTLRFGATKGAFHKLKVKSLEVGDEQTEITGASFVMNLGAGVKLGTLQFDAVLANDIYQNLGYLTSGNSTSGGLFPKVTATYSF